MISSVNFNTDENLDTKLIEKEDFDFENVNNNSDYRVADSNEKNKQSILFGGNFK